MGRKVPLPSGGYIIIEHTEAMVVIDVNSGRYAKNKEQELNSLKTDLEASER
jgi:ribonuclease G